MADCQDEIDFYLVSDDTSTPDPFVQRGDFAGSAQMVLQNGHWLVDVFTTTHVACAVLTTGTVLSSRRATGHRSNAKLVAVAESVRAGAPLLRCAASSRHERFGIDQQAKPQPVRRQRVARRLGTEPT